MTRKSREAQEELFRHITDNFELYAEPENYAIDNSNSVEYFKKYRKYKKQKDI